MSDSAAMMPNFFLIGAAKCGSTALTAMLGRHPDIFMPADEIAFFAIDERYRRGVDWYEQHFAGAGSATRRGENSNHYSMRELYPHAFERLVDHVDGGDLRFIYLVRHPLRRIESHWIEKRSHGGDEVHHDFNTAVFADRDRLLDPSDYWRQLQPYRAHFGDDAVLVVYTEDLEADPQSVLDRCFDFLGVEPHRVDVGERANPSSTKRVQRPVLSHLRRLPLYHQVSGRLPRGLRSTIRQRTFFSDVSGRPTWRPEVRTAVVAELADGVVELLAYSGKDADHWSFDVEVT